MSEEANIGVRMAFLGVVVIGLFAALFARIWFLQVLATEEFRVQADTNQVRLVTTSPIRGRILDRNGVILADNEYVGVLTVDPNEFADDEQRDFVLSEIERLTGESRDDLLVRLEDAGADPFAARVVVAGLDEQMLEIVTERALPGVTAEVSAIRIYPQGATAAHIVGYVGAQPKGWGARHPNDRYLPSDPVGRSGIEALFEQQLRGLPGARKIEVDRTNRIVRELGEDPSLAGHDVHLTIDLELQAAVEFFLDEGLRGRRGVQSEDDDRFFYPAYGGSAIVLDIRNGDVLAMASNPGFDPNWFIEGISREQFDSTFNDPLRPGALNNRAVQGLYAPGSVFKLVTSIAGTRAGVIGGRTQFEDEGFFEVPRDCGSTCRFRNAGNAVYGNIDLSLAITQSSDAYFYSIGYDLWNIPEPDERQWAIQDAAKDLGFGQQTGVQLPFEKAGRVPDAEIKRNLFEARPDVYLAEENSIFWVPGDNINLSVGQGFLTVTPLQLVNAYATWANGGTMFQPNIADRIESRRVGTVGDVVLEIGPRVVRQLDFSDVPRSVINEGLEGVTIARNTRSGLTEGTAFTAFRGWDNRGYGVVGKTGTAEADGINRALGRKKEDTAVFVGWAPRDDPRYAVVVVLEEAGFGGEAAAPVARNIIDALRKLEQNWEDPEDLPLVPVDQPGSSCPQIPITLLRDPTYIFRVPEGCPYGIPTPVITATTVDPEAENQ
jgi:penicillin-binding protein 2